MPFSMNKRHYYKCEGTGEAWLRLDLSEEPDQQIIWELQVHLEAPKGVLYGYRLTAGGPGLSRIWGGH